MTKLEELSANKKQFFKAVSFVFLATLPVVAIIIFSYYEITKRFDKETMILQQSKSSLSSNIIEERMDKLRDLAMALASRPKFIDCVGNGDWLGAINQQKDVIESFPYIDALFLSDFQGVLKEGYPGFRDILNQDFSYRDWYKGVIKNGRPYVSEAYQRANAPKRSVISVSAPIKSGGKMIGILILQLKPEILNNIGEDIHLVPREVLYVVDKNGNLIYHNKLPFIDKITDFTEAPAVQKALRGEHGVEKLYNSAEDEWYITAYEPLRGYGGGVIIAHPSRALMAKQFEELKLVIFFYVCLYAVIIALAGFSSYFFLKNKRMILRQASDVWQNTFDSISDFIFIQDKNFGFLKVNKSFCDAMKAKPEDFIGKKCYEVLHKSSQHWPSCPMAETLKDAKFHMQEVCDPNIGVPLLITTSPIFDRNGNLTSIVHIARNISELKRNEEALRKSRDLLNETGNIAKIGGWEFDAETLELTWTEEVYRIHEVDMDYKPTLDKEMNFYASSSRPAIEQAMRNSIELGEPFALELEFVTAKGDQRWVRVLGKVRQIDGKTKNVSGTFQDVSEIVLKEKKLGEQFAKLQYLSAYDSLTGVANRRTFLKSVNSIFQESKRYNHKFALLGLDIDKFKLINDQYGHDIGDAVLRNAAETISKSIRKGDVLARLGGDEFSLILSEIKSIDDAKSVAGKIVKFFANPLDINGNLVHCSMSIGVACYPAEGVENIEQLLKQADIAMYRAKNQGRNRFVFFDN